MKTCVGQQLVELEMPAKDCRAFEKGTKKWKKGNGLYVSFFLLSTTSSVP